MRVAVPIIRHQPANHSTFEIETEHTFQHTNLHTYIWAIVSPYSLTRLDRTYMCETRNNRPKRRRRKRRDRIKTYKHSRRFISRVHEDMCEANGWRESFFSEWSLLLLLLLVRVISFALSLLHSFASSDSRTTTTNALASHHLSLARERAHSIRPINKFQ